MEMEKIEEIARELGAEILKIGRPVKTVEQATGETGASPKQVIKSLVIISERGPLLVIVDGESKVDMEKLERLFGKCRFAKPEEVKELTGYEVGGVPPVGVPLRTIVDPRVLENEYVIGGGGSIDRLLRIEPRKILEYQNAEVMEVRK
ncbi:aminoacyl-tRNA deacylase [Thermococcus waiotapuensis]|uniref:YbaK/EbsC family protein n=1 Tax=Thermococcus waiotapuensis TaxID=90909 RepID=A0AAE4T0C4_9EURY|nr:YbaK/EbsC family protein [Thermococcus waiotapuensis]MDV3102980.1 YbaK/EbsC family protein [Thermococcus waiotapuensis]